MDIKNYNFFIKYVVNGKTFVSTEQNCQHFELNIEENSDTFKVTMQPSCKIDAVKSCKVTFPYVFKNQDMIFANGFQSWTDTKEYSVDQKMNNLKKICVNFANNSMFKNLGLNCSGDYKFHKYPNKRGVFYGYSYGYVKNGLDINLYGSLDERTGYTIFTFDTKKKQVEIEKELENVAIIENYEIFNIALISNSYDIAFDDYFKRMNVVCSFDKKMSGYTTWYNYYKRINEQIVDNDLSAIAKLDKKIDIFQIDDGYQHAIGDWLTTDIKKFPNGMKAVADKIHDKNMLAGLWLAPFAVCKNSDIYAQHIDWLVRDKKGKPIMAGPNWGGFYCLDLSNKSVRAHLHNVFDVVLNDWGYDMVKLDFLYAAGEFAVLGKSRGQLMCEAMDFIRECVGKKLLLGCGVPLMPAFGKVDFCRIGADLSLNWKRKKYALREDVSTPNTLECTVFRRHLNGRAFLNDPDVFLLRDDNIKMTFEQRKLATKINLICGSLLFTSDNVGKYNDNQVKAFYDAISKDRITVVDACFISKNDVKITYIQQGEKQEELTFDISCGILK